MFVNVNKIYGKAKELRISIADIAKQMGINRSTLYRKLDKDGSGLTVKDAQMLIEILSLTVQEAYDIFFAQRVA